MFAALLAVAPSIASLASAGGALFGGSGAPNANDQIRKNRAEAYFTHAVAGDVTSARILLYLKSNSATAYGKQIAAEAWALLAKQRPDIVTQAATIGPAQEEHSVGSGKKVSQELNKPTNATPSPLVQQVQSWQHGVNAVTAAHVQNIGAGTATVAADTIAGADNPHRAASPITIPTNATTLMMIAGAVALLAFLALKK